ncbi:MAG: Crp/Fnr family transcriptional regulator [Saprospiraceae bacterium]|nr:Crp/Fnr family transcriptional regulator [Saprospiraceae bacterium]
MVELSQQFEKAFPNISQASLRQAILEESDLMQTVAGSVILDLNQLISSIPLVLEGVVKVTRIDPQGKEILLYYIRPGESCAMTLSSAIRRGVSMIRASAQTDVKLLLIPLRSMLSYRVLYPSWNDFVVTMFAHRFDEMIDLVEDLTFHQVDYRLNKYLVAKATLLGKRELCLSHQQIAKEINTSREVVSRLLKRFEKEGSVALHRERITLLNSFNGGGS